MTEQVAELHQAFAWDCEKCGRENFVRSIVANPPPDEYLDSLKAIGVLESWQTLEDLPEGAGVIFQTCPSAVTCAHCGSTFAAKDDREN